MSDTRDDEPQNLPAMRQHQSSLATAEQRKVVSEIQARVAFARHNPRDQMHAIEQIERDCTRPRLAETAIYEYARGGTDISGPSIRLMETIARRWGNMASGIREVYRDTTDGFSECVAFAWDMESNYYDEREFVVRHWRDTRRGGYRLTDERDIYELIANYGQRRKRACLIAVIPGDVVEAAVEQCERTLSTHVDMKPETITRLVEAFGEYNVTRKQIETRIQRKLDAIHPAQVVQLRKIYASLKDGMSEATEWFPPENTPAWEEIQRRQNENVVPLNQRPPPPTRDEEPETKKAPAKKAAAGQKRSETAKKSESRKQSVAPPFEAYLLDFSGEPIGDVPHADPVKFIEDVLAEMGEPNAPALGIEEQNADGIADAIAASPEAKTLWESRKQEAGSANDDADPEGNPTIVEGEAETTPIAVIDVKKERGAANHGQYVRDFGAALSEHSPSRYLDFIAVQQPTIETLPRSAKLLVIKAIVAEAAKWSIEPPAEYRAQAERDQDAEYCTAHIAEMERASSLQGLREFATSTAVRTHYTRWQRERPELAERMDQAGREAEARLKPT